MAMATEQELLIKLQKVRAHLKKSIRLLDAKNRLRLLQNKYDGKVIKTLAKKDRKLYDEIIKELKPDFDKMQADKKVVFDEIARMKESGRWVRVKKVKPKK